MIPNGLSLGFPFGYTKINKEQTVGLSQELCSNQYL